MRRLIAETFEHVRVTARKVPNIPRIKVVRFGLSGRVYDRGAHTTFQDERPFRSGCVPVKLAHDAGLELHRYARDPFRDRQLLDGYFFPKAVPENFPFRFLQFEFESRQFFPGQQRIRDIVLKTDIAHEFIFLKRFARSNQANPDFIPVEKKNRDFKTRRAKAALRISQRNPDEYSRRRFGNAPSASAILIQRALDADAWLIEYVRVNHRCGNVFVTEQLLHGSNIVTVFE